LEIRIEVCCVVINRLKLIDRTNVYVNELKTFTGNSPIDVLKNLGKLIDDFNDSISSKIHKNVTFKKNMPAKEERCDSIASV
jgi:hypothetical protein